VIIDLRLLDFWWIMPDFFPPNVPDDLMQAGDEASTFAPLCNTFPNLRHNFDNLEDECDSDLLYDGDLCTEIPEWEPKNLSNMLKKAHLARELLLNSLGLITLHKSFPYQLPRTYYINEKTDHQGFNDCFKYFRHFDGAVAQPNAILVFGCLERSSDMKTLIKLMDHAYRFGGHPPLIIVSPYHQGVFERSCYADIEECMTYRTAYLIYAGAEDAIWTDMNDSFEYELEMSLLRIPENRQRALSCGFEAVRLHQGVDEEYGKRLAINHIDLLWSFLPNRIMQHLPLEDDLLGSIEQIDGVGQLKFASKIGEGMLGVVYLAKGTHSEHKEAIKKISKTKVDTILLLEAVYREYRLLMKVSQHPNIVILYRMINTSTDLYICLEYVGKENLFSVNR